MAYKAIQLEMRILVTGKDGQVGRAFQKELKHNTWVVADIPGDLLEHSQDDSLWRTVLSAMSEEWRLLAGEPDDPSRN